MQFAQRSQPAGTVPFIRKHSSFFVGLFLVVPVVIIVLLLVYTVLKATLMESWLELNVVYRNTFGLKSGNSVIISGCDVGRIGRVRLERENEVHVKIRVNPEYENLVRKNSRAVLKQKNLAVGDWCIELVGSPENSLPAQSGDTLTAEMPSGLDKTIDLVTSLIATIDSVVKGIAQGKGTVGRLVMQDTLGDLVLNIGRHVSNLSAHSGSTMRMADSLLLSLTQAGGAGKSLLDTVTTIVGSLQTTLQDIQTIMGNLRTASGDIPSMMTQVRDDLGEAEAMMRALQKNWIVKQAVGKQPDPLLQDAP